MYNNNYTGFLLGKRYIIIVILRYKTISDLRLLTYKYRYYYYLYIFPSYEIPVPSTNIVEAS